MKVIYTYVDLPSSFPGQFFFSTKAEIYEKRTKIKWGGEGGKGMEEYLSIVIYKQILGNYIR